MEHEKDLITLNESQLSIVSKKIPSPSYDRSKVKAGIVHIGVGAFHRSHQAMYMDKLMNEGEAMDWGICGVGLLPFDLKAKEALQKQNGLYTLIIKNPDGSYEPRVIGSIVNYLYAPDDPEAVLEKMADPATRIISLTITEGGYNFDQSTGKFNDKKPEIVEDLKNKNPTTVFGYVTEALRRRREKGVKPFTIVSCDNIQGNGVMAKNSFITFAKLKDADLGEWIEQNVKFPNSMVDRITPVSTVKDQEDVKTRYGVIDSWPVVSEPFVQWVIEDQFVDGRPPLEKAGVQVVPDVLPYELMKLRLLNASHQGLCYFAHLMGYSLVHEACQNQLIAKFLMRYMDEEATPTLQPVQGVDLGAYKKQLIERFSNGEVRDTVPRLCAETSDRIPKFLVPVIEKQVQSGGAVKYSAAIVASWARYAEGVDEKGEPINIVDNAKKEVMEAAAKQKDDKLAFIRNKSFFGNLADSESFTKAYTWTLNYLHEKGAKATLEELLK